MKNRKLEKFCLFLFIGLFIAAAGVFTAGFGQTYREYATIRAREALYRERLSDAETKLKEKEETLHRLRHDPVYIERMIRQRLGYARPGELVFRFEEPEEFVR